MARPAPRKEDAPEPDAIATPSASPADQPSAPVEVVDDFARVVAHLEFLGYSVSSEENGWSYAQHPHRYSFHLRAFPEGIRLDATVAITVSPGNSRAAWVDFLNSANAQSVMTRFLLRETTADTFGVTMRALATGGYSRRVFGLVMDMWHQDVDQVRRQPAFTEPSTDANDEAAATTIH